jgi:hypothetical protein
LKDLQVRYKHVPKFSKESAKYVWNIYSLRKFATTMRGNVHANEPPIWLYFLFSFLGLASMIKLSFQSLPSSKAYPCLLPSTQWSFHPKGYVWIN